MPGFGLASAPLFRNGGGRKNETELQYQRPYVDATTDRRWSGCDSRWRSQPGGAEPLRRRAAFVRAGMEPLRSLVHTCQSGTVRQLEQLT
jgi:hypothetical protein